MHNKSSLIRDWSTPLVVSQQGEVKVPCSEHEQLLAEYITSQAWGSLTGQMASLKIKRKRNRNLAYDLVGVELHPGPRTKAKSGSVSKLVSQVLSAAASRSGGGARKQRKSRGKSGGEQSGAMAANNTRITGVPAAFGFVAPRSYFRTSSTAQRMVQQDAKGSIRVHGCALFGSGVSTYSAATPAGQQGAFGSSTTPNRGYAVIAPTEIDPRLAAVSQTYQFYAFRRIRLRYIPFVGTSTTGGLYLAIAKDTEAAEVNFATLGLTTGDSAGTAQDIMDYDPSLMSAVWQPAQLDFQHMGTELWETYPNGEEPIDKRLQAAIVGVVETAAPIVSTLSVFGHLWLEYEVDFYVPGPPTGAN